MTEFVIYGHMDEHKNLIFDSPTICSQGENKTVALCVQVPNALATDFDFYFEFLCPHNLWVSPKADVVVGEAYTQVSFALTSALLQHQGQVIVQLVARKHTDQTVVYKSTLSTESSFFVSQSVNATANAPQAVDFLGETLNRIANLEERVDAFADVAMSGDYNDLTNTPQAPVTSVNGQTGDVVGLVDTHSDQRVNGLKTFDALCLESARGGVGKIHHNGYDETWTMPSESGTIALQSQIPTSTSKLTNDSGFISTLPIATKQSCGVVKVGEGLDVSQDGTISAQTQNSQCLFVNFSFVQNSTATELIAQCDTSYQDIEDAIWANKRIIGMYGNMYFNVSYHMDGGCISFSHTIIADDEMICAYSFYLFNDDSLEFYSRDFYIPQGQLLTTTNIPFATQTRCGGIKIHYDETTATLHINTGN